MNYYRWLKCQWDRAAAVVAAAIGLISIFLGWVGVSGKALPAEQLPYIASDAVFGLFALGVAATLWLSADLRDEWRRLDRAHRDLDTRLREMTGAELAASQMITALQEQRIEDALAPQPAARPPANHDATVRSGVGRP